MKLLKFQKTEATVQTEQEDDLWHLSQLIEKGDLLKGKTERKIKFGKEGDRKTSVERKVVFLTIEVEKVEFAATSTTLRVSGVVQQGTEDVPSGAHHSFSIDTHTKVTLEKKEWLGFQKKRLEESCQPKKSAILICVHDREQATFALLKSKGYEILSSLSGAVEKKGEKGQASGDFYADIIKKIAEYIERYKLQNVILASPAFFKEDVVKKITDTSLKKKIVLATCSTTGTNGVKEVIKRDEVKQVLKSDKIAQQSRLVESLLNEIAKGEKAVYGLDDTKKGIENGAVGILLITDTCIQKHRQDDTFQQIEKMMKHVEKMQGEVHIIATSHDAGQKLEGIGGIAGILRYNITI